MRIEKLAGTKTLTPNVASCSRTAMPCTVNRFILSIVTLILILGHTLTAQAAPLRGAALKRMKAQLLQDGLLHRKAKSSCVGKAIKSNKACDADKDRLINLREKKLKTNKLDVDTDHDGLKDRQELIKYLTDPRVADTDEDGIVDGNDDANGNGISDEDEDDKSDEGSTLEDDDDSNGANGGCLPPNFDTNGSTSKFGIPAGFTGNVTAGQTKYAQRCSPCHQGIDKGVNFAFSKLKSTLAASPMFITNMTTQEISDVVAYLNRTQLGGGGNCAPIDTPTAIATLIPTIAPTPVPTSTPTPIGFTCTCSGNGFNAACNSSSFGITAPLVGNMDVGQTTFNTCVGACHGLNKIRGVGFTYQQLAAAVTGPLMNINTVTNQQYADMTAFLNSSAVVKSCVGPTPTRTRTPTPTRTATPTATRTPTPAGYSCSCGGTGFNTSCQATGFGIPSGVSGDMDIGQSTFNTCVGACHGVDKLRGVGFTYQQLSAAVTGPLMNISTVTVQQYADMVAYLNSATAVKSCSGPTPTPTRTPIPTITPTATATRTPTPVGYSCTCSGTGFDSSCSSTSFGIPAGLTGNIDTGASTYAGCRGACHGDLGMGLTYQALQAAVTGPLMRINTVTNQQYADITAYLNSLAVIKSCSGPTPTATATPNPVEQGRIIFTTSCSMSGCHSFDSNGNPREIDSRPSRSKIHSALRSGPDNMPQFLGLTLGATAPPYSAAEEALYQYLQTVP